MSYYYATVGDPARHATTTCSITPLTTLNARHATTPPRATPCATRDYTPLHALLRAMIHAKCATTPRAQRHRAPLRHAMRDYAITRHENALLHATNNAQRHATRSTRATPCAITRHHATTPPRATLNATTRDYTPRHALLRAMIHATCTTTPRAQRHCAPRKRAITRH